MKLHTTVLIILHILLQTPEKGTSISIGDGYFVDPEPRTWSESKAFCESNNMVFVENIVDSTITFFKNTHNSTFFDGTHWIGARNAINQAAVVWDSSSPPAMPVTGNTPWVNSLTEYKICGAYYSHKTAPYFRLQSCDLKYKVLCKQK